MPEAVEINPELLTWARETAGLSLKEAAEKLGLKDFRAWERRREAAQARGGRAAGQ